MCFSLLQKDEACNVRLDKKLGKKLPERMGGGVASVVVIIGTGVFGELLFAETWG